MSSCLGCKFLYGDGSGYSNYTWMDTFARCAMNKNPNLEGEVNLPYSIQEVIELNSNEDTWEPTKDSRCESYSPGILVVLDPDRECWLDDDFKWEDEEQKATIAKAEGIEKGA